MEEVLITVMWYLTMGQERLGIDPDTRSTQA
jgi:cation transporter-like permease